ncbi:MAG: hypothetical protein JKY93_03035 [Gammaproteobacteria bacterium]|nr:hypothetical protein [Gammaproteobacteria bacterium]MBL4761655.1 hypothetical protein [Gammaproteobacteria bacterium]
MNKLLYFGLIATFLTSGSLSAQTISYEEMEAKGEANDIDGYIPKSMESLVGTSSVIIKGRFGNFLSNDLSFGYADTRESLKKAHALTDAELDRIGVPISRYEIIVDEVLLGRVDESTVVYTLLELPPTDRSFTHPAVTRLFFLVENPDGSYSPRGPASVLNQKEGSYTYDALTNYSDAFRDKRLDFLPKAKVDDFEKALAEVIATEKSKR